MWMVSAVVSVKFVSATYKIAGLVHFVTSPAIFN